MCDKYNIVKWIPVSHAIYIFIHLLVKTASNYNIYHCHKSRCIQMNEKRKKQKDLFEPNG